ncbi:9229_t:CDS:2, partial [Funneliformis geosporum]
YKDVKRDTLGIAHKEKSAVCCKNGYGPFFGDIDIYFIGNGCHSAPNSYPNIGKPNKFVIDDYEVFQEFMIKTYVIERK